MEARGFSHRETERPDLLMVYRARSRDRVDVYRDFGYPRRWGPAYDVHRYREGTLILTMVDTRRDRVVWEGVGEGVVGSTDDREKTVNDAIARILEDFPPR
jgi:hypothetical protein